MVDTIGNITFTNVSLNELGGGSQAFSPATLNIDYTTNTVAVDPSGPALTFNGHTFSSFTLTQQPALLGGAYVLTSGTYPLGPVFELSWSGHSPDAFNTYPPPLAYAGGAAFDGFLHNQIAGDELGAVGGGEGICFAAGTLIRTPGGDVPVEHLTAGDLVLTASGEMRPVKWMGHSDVDFQLTPNASQPIRIAAEAFGPADPRRTSTSRPAIRSAWTFWAKCSFPSAISSTAGPSPRSKSTQSATGMSSSTATTSSSPTTCRRKAIWRWPIAAPSRSCAASFPPSWRDASAAMPISAAPWSTRARYSTSSASDSPRVPKRSVG